MPLVVASFVKETSHLFSGGTTFGSEESEPSLPKTVTFVWIRRELNPGPTALKASVIQ